MIARPLAYLVALAGATGVLVYDAVAVPAITTAQVQNPTSQPAPPAETKPAPSQRGIGPRSQPDAPGRRPDVPQAVKPDVPQGIVPERPPKDENTNR